MADVLPAAQVGGSLGSNPYPKDSSGDVHPQAPTAADGVGSSPYPIDSSGDVHPNTDRHDGSMNLHLGESTKPLGG